MAKELTPERGGALNQIEQVRADAAKAIAEAEALCKRMREALAALQAERPRLRVLQLPNRESRN